ncbi:MAG: TIGR04282 family arsenosugar biosynthesis glycosyltransferase [Thermodesulfovibrionales bacterium]|nr:TIGR04282 family arsenosugar biosynthesis glycosyltransferase [Thermodesulfovibrionales bacterium]
MSPEQSIILFVRFPEKGRVKTRLAKDIGEENVWILYKYFVLDLLETVSQGNRALKICYSPPEAGGGMKDWLGSGHSYMPQCGRDLGEKMRNAIEEVFGQGCSEIILIGSDIPDLPHALIESAYAFARHDAVIGPSHDGGYYLIGFKKETFLPEIFEGIAWGTERVFGKTMEIFTDSKYNIRILPLWQDVDRLADLKALYQRNINTPFAVSRTMAYLSQNLDLIR